MATFCFIDRVLECRPEESLIALFKLEGHEEFLKDHFKNFPVMPGVLLLETLKQAAAALLTRSNGYEKSRFRLASAKDIRFGQFVKPGSVLKAFVHLKEKREDVHFFDGRLDLVDDEGVRSKGRAITASFELVAV